MEVTIDTMADEAAPSNGTEPSPADKDQLIQRAQNHGWTQPTAFNYDEFTRTDANDADWHGTARVYEWEDGYGDVAPAVPELERVLFGGEFQMRKGEHIHNLDLLVTVEGPVKVAPARKVGNITVCTHDILGSLTIIQFEDCGLHPVLLKNVEMCGYDKPTPIQAYAIPAVLQGVDVVAVAQTGKSTIFLSIHIHHRLLLVPGSGKTAAYMIPVMSRLMGKAKKLCAPKPHDCGGRPVKAEPLVVVVVPTRELAMQIFDEARRLCYRSMLRPCVMYGGLPMGVCREELGKGCDVLIATPGRLTDLMDKPHLFSMSRVK